MNKLSRKSYLTLIAATGMLILLSTLLLKKGISFSSESSIGKVENIPTVKLDSKAPTKETIEKLNNSKGTPIDLKKQEELYQSVKDRINIQKEDAIIIFNKNIHNLFGESLVISNDNLFLTKNYISKKESYDWLLSVTNEKIKKSYWCILNAMTGECTKIMKIDYNGLRDLSDGLFISGIYEELKDNKLELYINKARGIITKNNILNSKSNNIHDISLKGSFYIGLRPIARMNVTMENGKTVEVGFYIDTDELLSIDLQNN